MKATFYQYRNFKWIYLFTVKNADVVSLKIFDIAQHQLFKCNIPADTFNATLQKDRPNMALITKDLPTAYRIETADGNTVFQSCYRQLVEHISEYSAELFAGKVFVDPISKDALKSPVIDAMGHTFERKNIEQWVQKKTKLCPLARHVIELPLVKNHLVAKIMNDVRDGKTAPIPQYKEPVVDEHGYTHEKATIETLMKGKKCIQIAGRKVEKIFPNYIIKDVVKIDTTRVIPTFSAFKEDDPKRAKRWLEKAFHYARSKRYSYALECYANAFKYTKNWRYYAPIVAFFEKVEKKDKSALAQLYLARYQLDAGDTKEAINTLKSYKDRSVSFPFLDVCPILISLYLFTNRPQQAVDLLMQFLAKKSYNNTLSPYNDILEKNSALLPYDKLASFVTSPVEKMHIFYKEVLDLCPRKSISEIESFIKKLHDYNIAFLNKLVLFEVRRKAGVDIALEMLRFARELGRKGLWKEMLIAYKILCNTKYTKTDHYNKFYAYMILGKKEKTKSYLIQQPKALKNLTFARKLGLEKFWEAMLMVYDMIPPKRYRQRDHYYRHDAYVALGEKEKASRCILQYARSQERDVWCFQGFLTSEDINVIFNNMPPELKTLHFFYSLHPCNIATLIQQLSSLPKRLISLSFNFCDIGETGALALAQNMPAGLCELWLNNNNIGYHGVEALAQNLPSSLHILQLSGNIMGAKGVQALALRLPVMLHTLALSDNNIGDSGVATLVQHLPAGLRELRLDNNNIGDEGILALVRHLPQTLESLHLRDNNITIDGILAIVRKTATMSAIAHVDLCGNYLQSGEERSIRNMCNGTVHI